MQEGRVGRDTVLAVYPDTKVIMRRVNKYPVMLTVFKVEGECAWMCCM